MEFLVLKKCLIIRLQFIYLGYCIHQSARELRRTSSWLLPIPLRFWHCCGLERGFRDRGSGIRGSPGIAAISISGASCARPRLIRCPSLTDSATGQSGCELFFIVYLTFLRFYFALSALPLSHHSAPSGPRSICPSNGSPVSLCCCCSLHFHCSLWCSFKIQALFH